MFLSLFYSALVDSGIQVRYRELTPLSSEAPENIRINNKEEKKRMEEEVGGSKKTKKNKEEEEKVSEPITESLRAKKANLAGRERELQRASSSSPPAAHGRPVWCITWVPELQVPKLLLLPFITCLYLFYTKHFSYKITSKKGVPRFKWRREL